MSSMFENQLLCLYKVMKMMTNWLMTMEKSATPRGNNQVPQPKRHMFSCFFVENLQKYETITNPSVLDDEVDPEILGYDLAMCSVLFLPVLLKSPKHWYVIAINQVDKRLEVLDPLSVNCQEKITANADAISGLYKVLQRTRKNLHSDFHIHDCGFYVLRFMEHWTGGRFNTSQLEVNSTPTLVIICRMHNTIAHHRLTLLLL
ncbi:hypothetical protein RHSIM_Rhsim09G0072800 [Rhododendron simsii]|uniref:Ubiquitin-like protease family profile domain-containing protein n=1 Tax=Rhododendron simsii TaxID=118357 RepID=A0A834GK97_RHOSS|nr:hypothetical protein RHSIM_Rhsim09G0072800 [Rhododendron simsii]